MGIIALPMEEVVDKSKEESSMNIKKNMVLGITVVGILGCFIFSGVKITAEEKPVVVKGSETVFYVDDINTELKLYDLEQEKNFYCKDTSYGIDEIFELNRRTDRKQYDIEYTLPAGGKIELAESKGRTDGSLLILDGNGELVGAIDRMRCFDTKNAEVPVTVQVKNNIVTYTIDDTEHRNNYPIKGTVEVYADVNDFHTWFLSGKCETRADGVTFALEPTGGWAGMDASVGVISWSWNTVVKWFEGNYYWENETGMYEQYYCHVVAGRVPDGIWNLEPWRPCVGIAATLLAECNP